MAVPEPTEPRPGPLGYAIAELRPCAFTHLGPMCDDPYERCEGCRPERDGTRWVVPPDAVNIERVIFDGAGDLVSAPPMWESTLWREVDSDA